MKRYFILLLTIIITATIILVGCTQPAQPAPSTPSAPTPAAPKTDYAEFYKGKTVTLLSTSSAGSVSDIFARAFAPYFQEALGAANVVVKNETEGAGMVVTNNFYNGNIKGDGLSILFTPSGACWANWAYDSPGVEYDITKFKYLGADAVGQIAFILTTKPPYNTLEAVQKADKTLNLVVMGVRSKPTICAAIVAAVFDLPVQIVPGFKGSRERLLAIEQEEAIGSAFPLAAAVNAAKQGKVNVLFTILKERDVMYPDVPAITEVSDLSEKQMAYLGGIEKRASSLVMGPPSMPDDLVTFLRGKTAEVYKNPAYPEAVIKAQGAWKLAYTGEELVEEAEEIAKAKPVFGPLYKEIIAKYIKQ